MNIEEMKARKRELGYSNKMVSELSGVPLGTVQKIFSGASKAPRYDTVQALEKLFLRADHRKPALQMRAAALPSEPDPERASELPSYSLDLSFGAGYVREQSSAFDYGWYDDASAPGRPETEELIEDARTRNWRRQGTYTIDDYHTLPGDVRVELIDGVFYNLSSPLRVHQLILGEVFFQFLRYKKERGDDFDHCNPYVAPVDVQLNCDDRTVVQPDLLVLCHEEEQEDDRVFHGAPSFVMEILSDSTRQKDIILKTNKYLHAGVREYWIVDPKNERVTVYDFASGNYPIQYMFEDQVPVGITGGGLEVDFSEFSKGMHQTGR